MSGSSDGGLRPPFYERWGVDTFLQVTASGKGSHRPGPRPPRSSGVTPSGRSLPAVGNLSGMLGHCRPPCSLAPARLAAALAGRSGLRRGGGAPRPLRFRPALLAPPRPCRRRPSPVARGGVPPRGAALRGRLGGSAAAWARRLFARLSGLGLGFPLGPVGLLWSPSLCLGLALAPLARPWAPPCRLGGGGRSRRLLAAWPPAAPKLRPFGPCPRSSLAGAGRPGGRPVRPAPARGVCRLQHANTIPQDVAAQCLASFFYL